MVLIINGDLIFNLILNLQIDYLGIPLMDVKFLHTQNEIMIVFRWTH